MSRTDESTEATKEAREEIVTIANIHPLTVDEVYELGLFKNRKTAASWLSTNISNGWLQKVGEVKWPDRSKGRRKTVVCNGWWPKSDNLRHEMIATKVWMTYRWEGAVRYDPTDPIRSDMKWPDLDGKMGRLEIFCCTQGKKQWASRLEKYEGNEDYPLIVVAPKRGNSERELQKLLSWSRSFTQAAFTTWDRIDADAGGNIWVDCQGNVIDDSGQNSTEHSDDSSETSLETASATEVAYQADDREAGNASFQL